MTAGPAISLPRFEGPLDLLLSLVRRNQVEITDIPIAEITRQYLDYIDDAGRLDRELGSEFAYMAATLIHIKSRSLLACDPEVAAREPDPRQELIRQLLEHDQVREGADFLRQQLQVTSGTFARSSVENWSLPEPEPGDPEATAASINLIQLLRLAKNAVETARTHDLLELDTPEVTIAEMMLWLESRISAVTEHHRLASDVLFAEQAIPSRQIPLFLAMLELSKAGTIQLEQYNLFEPIYLAPLQGHNCALT